MRSIHNYETHVPQKKAPERSNISRQEFWSNIHKRYEEVRFGRVGRIIGYIAVFTVVFVFIFLVILALENYPLLKSQVQ
jgi:hypothetical protein